MIHFPLKPRLEALLRCESFAQEMGFESWRPQPKAGIVAGACDVYMCAVLFESYTFLHDGQMSMTASNGKKPSGPLDRLIIQFWAV